MEYRFYFLGPDCRIYGPACSFAAASDWEALQKAEAIYRAAVMPHHGFEVWQGKRCVHTHNC